MDHLIDGSVCSYHVLCGCVSTSQNPLVSHGSQTGWVSLVIPTHTPLSMIVFLVAKTCDLKNWINLKFNTNFLHGIVTFLHATLNEMNAQIYFSHVTRTFLHATFQKIIAIYCLHGTGTFLYVTISFHNSVLFPNFLSPAKVRSKVEDLVHFVNIMVTWSFVLWFICRLVSYWGSC
jgi:hypothetical protein